MRNTFLLSITLCAIYGCLAIATDANNNVANTPINIPLNQLSSPHHITNPLRSLTPDSIVPPVAFAYPSQGNKDSVDSKLPDPVYIPLPEEGPLGNPFDFDQHKKQQLIHKKSLAEIKSQTHTQQNTRTGKRNGGRKKWKGGLDTRGRLKKKNKNNNKYKRGNKKFQHVQRLKGRGPLSRRNKKGSNTKRRTLKKNNNKKKKPNSGSSAFPSPSSRRAATSSTQLNVKRMLHSKLLNRCPTLSSNPSYHEFQTLGYKLQKEGRFLESKRCFADAMSVYLSRVGLYGVKSSEMPSMKEAVDAVKGVADMASRSDLTTMPVGIKRDRLLTENMGATPSTQTNKPATGDGNTGNGSKGSVSAVDVGSDTTSTEPRPFPMPPLPPVSQDHQSGVNTGVPMWRQHSSDDWTSKPALKHRLIEVYNTQLKIQQSLGETP